MEHKKFSDVIECVKINACTSCETYRYTLPLPITKEIDFYLLCFGPLKYSLEKVSIIKLDNDYMRIEGQVGLTTLVIKFKKDIAQKKIMEVQLANYLYSLNNNISLTF